MKFLKLLLLVLFVALPTAAQTTSPATRPDPVSAAESNAVPGISIDRISWRKEIFIPALYEDPMIPNQEQSELVREQRAVRKENAARTKGGEAPLAIPTRSLSAQRKEIPPGRLVSYIYEAKIKNTGAKSIRAIAWEYQLFDPESEVQVGRHEFVEATKIGPGKTATLAGYSTSLPTSILQAEKGDSPKYSERVRITRIEYADGSFWQRPVDAPDN
ncbi:MAG TPA: hypothetical protein VLL54_21765 [Pyrinomonadaceae bacterium]|nr:hypothetical protein [Pyrinomonadaceae bacterium]